MHFMALVVRETTTIKDKHPYCPWFDYSLWRRENDGLIGFKFNLEYIPVKALDVTNRIDLAIRRAMSGDVKQAIKVIVT
jgi:hypothetical protein